MPNMVWIIALVPTFAVAVWASARYLILKRSIRRANYELREIVDHLGDNRIVKLVSPERDFEVFLDTVNVSLIGIRQQAVLYARHEAELRAQIESISHDLRTPLTSIQGYLSLVDEEGLDDETRRSLATVARKAQQLQRLVAQFYELSCLRDEKFVLQLETVDAGRLLRESASGHYSLFHERGLDVRLSVPQHPLWTRANDDALERVFLNLLNNAGKYAKTKLEVVATNVAVAPGASMPRIFLSFANDTDRIGEDELAQLLEPFYTVDASRSQESSGLGLTISRHLVERMGGNFQVRHEVRNGGSWLVFEVQFDAVDCPDGLPLHMHP